MSGLTCEQLDELEARITELLEEPWVKGSGRPRDLTLREALIVACGYERNNITEEIWAEIFDVDQSTISRYITFLTPLIDQATEEFRPTAEDAAEATRDAIALVDGTLWPCWSWSGNRKLWAGKYKTTGHGSLIITNLEGRVTFVSEPVTGNQHDMAKLKESELYLTTPRSLRCFRAVQPHLAPGCPAAARDGSSSMTPVAIGHPLARRWHSPGMASCGEVARTGVGALALGGSRWWRARSPPRLAALPRGFHRLAGDPPASGRLYRRTTSRLPGVFQTWSSADHGDGDAAAAASAVIASICCRAVAGSRYGGARGRGAAPRRRQRRTAGMSSVTERSATSRPPGDRGRGPFPSPCRRRG